MKKLALSAVMAAALTLTTGWAWAAKLGDPAKPLAIAEWVKHGPVDLEKGKGKNIFVIEFWATWCPPCRKSIPHLSELQGKYKDKGVVVVGITSEEADTVKPFVEKQGANMEYAVAIDDQGKTGEAYMAAFKQDGIPHAFVVDKKGIIVWHGHPMGNELVKVLDKLIAGTFSLETIAKEKLEATQRREHFENYFELAESGADKKKADEEGVWLMENGAADPGLLCLLSYRILSNEDLKYRDKDLAMRAAQKAYDLTGGKEPGSLHVYAMALFDAGKGDEAIKYQKQAIAANSDEGMADFLKEALAQYESKTTAPAK